MKIFIKYKALHTINSVILELIVVIYKQRGNEMHGYVVLYYLFRVLNTHEMFAMLMAIRQLAKVIKS